MKLENIEKIQELSQLRKNYLYQKSVLEDQEINIKNNEDLKIFVLRNINLIDNEASTLAHLNALKNIIKREINSNINKIEQELIKLD